MAVVLDPTITTALGASIFIVLGIQELFPYIKSFGLLSQYAPIKDTDDVTVIKSTSPSSSPAITKITPDVPIEWIHCDSTKDVSISLYETIFIGLGLCFTNIAGGLAAGLAGYSVVYTTLGSVLASFLLLVMGQAVGIRCGEVIPERYLSLVSGVALIALGINGIVGDT